MTSGDVWYSGWEDFPGIVYNPSFTVELYKYPISQLACVASLTLWAEDLFGDFTVLGMI